MEEQAKRNGARAVGGGYDDLAGEHAPPHQNFASSKGKRKIHHPLPGDLHQVDPTAGLIRRAPVRRSPISNLYTHIYFKN
jgi:hypothetical protein